MATYSRTLSGLAPGEDYIIRVRSISKVGVLSDWSDSIRITPPAVSGPNYGIPGEVANVSVTPGMRILYLNFDANTESGLTGYNIHVSDTASFTADATNLIKTIAPTTFTAVEKYYDTTATTIKDMVSSTVAAPTTYYIKIYAVSIGGISPTATEVSGSPGQVDENTVAGMSIDKLQVGDLKVAMGLTSGVIQTAATGTRFTIDGNNIKGYRSDNSVWYDLNRVAETLTVGANGFNTDTSGNIWSGNASFGSAPFSVSSVGNMVAGTVTAQGNITLSGSGAFRTAASGNRVEITNNPITYLSGTQHGMTGYTGFSTETVEGSITVGGYSSLGREYGVVLLRTPKMGHDTADLTLSTNDVSGTNTASFNCPLTADYMMVRGGLGGSMGEYYFASGVTSYVGMNSSLGFSVAQSGTEHLRVDTAGTAWTSANLNIIGRTLWFGGSMGVSSNDYIQYSTASSLFSAVVNGVTAQTIDQYRTTVDLAGYDGGLAIGRVWLGYEGVKTASMTYGAEYMIMSNGTHTYVSGGTGGSTYIRAGANSATGQIQLDGTWAHIDKPAFSNLPTATSSDFRLYVTSSGEVRKRSTAGL